MPEIAYIATKKEGESKKNHEDPGFLVVCIRSTVQTCCEKELYFHKHLGSNRMEWIRIAGDPCERLARDRP